MRWFHLVGQAGGAVGLSRSSLSSLVEAPVMSSTRRNSKAPHTLSAVKCSRSQRLQHTSSDGKGNQRGGLKLQFPDLPKEWEGKYIPGQMYKYQDSLPKLPVPPLHQTLQKYITSLEPLLSTQELEHTKAVVAAFGKAGGTGEKLQEVLLERSRIEDNWLVEWWTRVAYLGFRESVVVNSSAAVGLPRIKASTVDEYVSEAVPADMYRGRPMCMSQHDCFSKCRLPGREVDTVRKTPIVDSRHVVVIRNGHIFKLDVLYECPDGTLAVAPASHIMEQLHDLLDAASKDCEHPVGILTTEHRDTWYQCRERLMQDSTNRTSLDKIERALFVVCLDKAHPHTAGLDSESEFNDFQKTLLANNFLHGNGTQFNTCNRWFDTIQIFLGEDGGAGGLLEHSVADGPASLAIDLFCMDTQKMYDVLGEQSLVAKSVLCPVEQLQWNISSQSAKDIQTAKDKVDELIWDVDLQITTLTDFGLNAIKSFKLSPDGFIQNGIQLAYYKLYKKTVATYESGGTRFFKLGRTDTIRSATNASQSFVKKMSDPNISEREKADSLIAAIKAHSNYTIEAISGQAVDRHMLGLMLLARESGMEIPEIFKDPAYVKSNHFCLSTSQVPEAKRHELFLCFGAVVPDGYGVCYNTQETKITLAVSSFRSYTETDSLLFGKKLAESLNEMQAVLIAAKGLSTKL